LIKLLTKMDLTYVRIKNLLLIICINSEIIIIPISSLLYISSTEELVLDKVLTVKSLKLGFYVL